MQGQKTLGYVSDSGLGELLADHDRFEAYSRRASLDETALRFRQQIQRARRITLETRKCTEEDKARRFDQFAQDHRESWTNVTNKRCSFLHMLASDESDIEYFISLQWLMERAMRERPEMMGCLDEDHKTPLTVALYQDHLIFVRAACDQQDPKIVEKIRSALEGECVESVDITCLHAALRCKFRSEQERESIVKAMCRFVPKQMFTKKDSLGCTPLHLAVDFKRCQTATQLGIVQTLLENGPEALEVDFDSMKLKYSVFQFHQRSRDINERLQESSQAAGRSSSVVHNGKSQSPETETVDDSSNEGPFADLRSAERATITAPAQPQSVSIGSDSQIEALPAAMNQCHVKEPLSHHQEQDKRPPADIIRDNLKLAYLRKEEPESASRRLQGSEETSKEFWFDFGVSKTLSKLDFRTHFDHLQFDPFLKYVSFPNVKWDEKKMGPGGPGSKVRKDMVYAFDWLKGKGVKHIVKVIVDDFEAPCHSDEALEEALKPFKIEELDWRRLDIDPVSLKKIGGCLQKVHLYWSGQNIVLRAWSEKDGLAAIPTLGKISISYEKLGGHDSEERTKENIEEFKRRLKESRPTGSKSLEVIFSPSASSHLPQPETQSHDQFPEHSRQPVATHKWIKCMDDFAEHFRQIKVDPTPGGNPSLGPVKIALIDDGVDFTHLGLKAAFTGRSFDYYSEGGMGCVRPYWDSTTGHGTRMAKLILRVCPNAIIHVIKLRTFMGHGSERPQIEPRSATKAIKYASELPDVQIISMSWTMKPPSDTELMQEFDDAMHVALSKKRMLVFCAASDQGHYGDFTYPYESNHHSFKIGAAKATGSSVDNVGDIEGIDFLLPGHEILIDDPSRRARNKRSQENEPFTGSSIATALAAGLAGLFIECVRIGVAHTAKLIQQGQDVEPAVAIHEHDWTRIRERGQMKNAFRNISVGGGKNDKYIEVWRTFEGLAKELRNSRGPAESEVIAALARIMLKKCA